MTMIYPGQPPTEFKPRPDNPKHHGYDKTPLSTRREWPPVQHPDPGEHYYCSELRMWRRVVRVPDAPRPTCGTSAIPHHDASGRLWRAIDRATGSVLWTIEAATFDLALIEKRRLCKLARGRSGDVYLQEPRA
jgi:hypothetical protein